MDILDFINTYWSYLSIPVVSAIVGYGTNWLAVKMMMYPVEFAGVGHAPMLMDAAQIAVVRDFLLGT